jgi:hypothetical protein
MTCASRRSVRGLWLLLTAGTCAGLAWPAWAQEAPAAARDVGAIDGRGFAGVRYSQAVVKGPLSFAGARVWTWADGGVQRLVAEGDVRANIAGYEFRAKACAAWLETVEVDGRQVTQVFAYFEELGSGADLAGSVSLTSSRLPVRAMVDVEGGIGVTADLLRAEAGGDAAFVARARAALVKSLKREAGVLEEETPPPLPRVTRRGAPERRVRGPLITPEQVTTRPLEMARRPEGGAEGQRPAPGRVPAPPTRTAAGPTPPPPAPPVTGRVPQESPPGEPLTTRRAEPEPSSPAGPARPAPRPRVEAAASAYEGEPIFARDGVVTVAPGPSAHISVERGAEENSIIATGGVTVQYEDPRQRVVVMKAQRLVIFTDPGDLEETARLGAETVRGVFLEGGVVVSDGTQTIRAPHVYYDLKTNRGIMLDAVYETFDPKRRLPLYVRAKEIRQEAARQFVAKQARFTNTAFFDPELAIGATQVRISRQQDVVEADVPEGAVPPAAEAEERTIVDARNITLQLMGVPVFYWPRYSGDPSTFPIRDFRIENRSGSGGAVRATLNAYALLGLARPRDLEVDLLTDFYFERGAGLGTRVAWDKPGNTGGVYAYGLPSDRGTDILKPGTRVNHDGEFRGMIVAEERLALGKNWTLLAEAASISDPNFIAGFFSQMGENYREFTNRVRVSRREANTYFSAEAKATFDDFLSNEYLLQSQGYAVDRLPEGYYARLGDDLLSEVAPGLLTWSSEYRLGRVGFSFDEVEARERGFSRNTLSQRAFGINFDQSIGQSLRAAGLFESAVTRADTRQEVSVQTSVGPVQVMPFAVGRVTFWDDEFEGFSPGNDDNVRLWSAAGVRLGTTLQHVYEGVDSRLLDIHRIRHLVEPSATVWFAGTNIEARELPVYDYGVEGVSDGTMVRAGVTHTFQTQRGGPGQWHSVDLLRVSVDYVYSSEDATRKSPIPRFFDYRPELSSAGEFIVLDAAVRLTDATTLTGGFTFDIDADQQATSNAGLLVRHSPGFVTLGEVRYVNPQDATYLTVGTSYELTEKYAAAVGLTYDATSGGFQSTAVELRRRYSSLMLGLSVSYNDISGETSFGFVFQPYGAAGAGRITGLGSSDPMSSAGGTSFWR